MACLTLVPTGMTPLARSAVGPDSAPGGYGPSDLLSAYQLPDAASGAGTGMLVAIVDAFDLPTAESDLATYRSQFGLSPCTTANGCFSKVDENGGTSYPAADANWGGEIALDIEMVSAICPNCHILLVEASSALGTDLFTAVDTAVSLGAEVVSNSYGGSEFPGESSYDSYFQHPGVAITVSSGDDGYGVQYPAASRYVTSVGGTSLARAANGRGWSETAWGSTSDGTGSGPGSGCSQYETKPSWQHDSSCAKRTVADVSAVADPSTGVAVYSTPSGGWVRFGGTSVAAPIIGGVYALAGTPAAGSYPASLPYARTASSTTSRAGRTVLAAAATCAPRRPATTARPASAPRSGPGRSPRARCPAPRRGSPLRPVIRLPRSAGMRRPTTGIRSPATP